MITLTFEAGTLMAKKRCSVCLSPNACKIFANENR
jgi:hypothetical protein